MFIVFSHRIVGKLWNPTGFCTWTNPVHFVHTCLGNMMKTWADSKTYGSKDTIFGWLLIFFSPFVQKLRWFVCVLESSGTDHIITLDCISSAKSLYERNLILKHVINCYQDVWIGNSSRPCLLPKVSWDRLQRPTWPQKGMSGRNWMNPPPGPKCFSWSSERN